MGVLSINGMRFYAFHGYFPQEQLCGGWFTVNVSVEVDMTLAGKSDELEETVNYGLIWDIAKEEMATPSKLIEEVATRILNRVRNLAGAGKTTVMLLKNAPPIKGSTASTMVKLVLN